MQERRIASVDEMFDLLATMPNGKFATICYVNAVPVYKMKNKVDLDKFGQDLDKTAPQDGMEDQVHARLSQYRSDDKMKKMNNIGAFVSIQRYTLNWSSEESHRKNLARYMSKKDEIDKRWGIYKEPEDRREGGFDTVNSFGASVGDTENTRNRAYIHQNTAKARIKSEIFAVEENGDIIGFGFDDNNQPLGKVNPEMIKSLRQSKSKSSEVKALEALNKSDEEIKQYQKEIADLNFKHQKFLVSKILYIIATIGEDKFVYINDRLAENIDTKSKAVINTQQFIEIANRMYRQDETMTESRCRKFSLIKENLMKQITESIDTVKIDEGLYNRLIEDACHSILNEYGDDEDYGYEDFDEEEEEEIDPFEEYQQDYPNGDFNPSEMDVDDLAHWCNTHSFGYVIPNIFSGQLQFRWADEKRLNCEMAYRIYNSKGIQPTHDVDLYIERPLQNEFDEDYVAVYSVDGFIGDEGEPVRCYIVYQRPKDEAIEESRFSDTFDSVKKGIKAGRSAFRHNNMSNMNANTGKKYYDYGIGGEEFTQFQQSQIDAKGVLEYIFNMGIDINDDFIKSLNHALKAR